LTNRICGAAADSVNFSAGAGSGSGEGEREAPSSRMVFEVEVDGPAVGLLVESGAGAGAGAGVGSGFFIVCCRSSGSRPLVRSFLSRSAVRSRIRCLRSSTC
jgi:hypothetical protein